MKALLFQIQYLKTYELWTRNTNSFTLFLYIGTLGEIAIQSCEYHILVVPRPRT